eukprot:Gb_06638 [translate_table: standard]
MVQSILPLLRVLRYGAKRNLTDDILPSFVKSNGWYFTSVQIIPKELTVNGMDSIARVLSFGVYSPRIVFMGFSERSHMSNHRPQGSHRTARVSAVHHSSSYWLGKDANCAKENVNGSNPGQSTDFSPSKRVMVVVDPSKEAEVAVLWALTHVVYKTDTVILLHVLRPFKPSSREARAILFAPRDPEEPQRRLDAKACETANSMKAMCKLHRPEVRVEILVMQGDAGPIIVNQAKKRDISLLVLGQPKPSLLQRVLAGSKEDMVEYCINNAGCLTLAVRKQSGEIGGYLINSKRLKNFWMLA